ncbi:hypothetical protein [Jannaschia sp. CCS1]|uniref:hypothetical protein n=1 Tax=Jannaschia sp. (strain CCS1) TaxID=290400 RepID=UPI000053DD0F|nr:hypothetical protein [Jannaschia sp. CCS1]ABD55196.1 hypothetical protein Jann_2279 [Jannaschia sp. CCS1]
MIRIATLSLAVAVSGGVAAGAWVTPPAQAQEVQAARSIILADEAPDLHRLLDTMGMYEIIALIGTEGLRGAADVEDQLFPEAGGAAWRATVMGLHGTDRMVGLFEEAFNRDGVTPAQIAEVQAFLDTDIGRRLIAGEVAARRAFLDDDAVAAATDIFMTAVQGEDPRLDLLRRVNEVNGLIDRNVSGALNLRFSFYRGLIDGGAFDNDVPEDLMLAEVWGHEPEVRQATVERLFSFQLLAYSGASDADLEAYIEIAASPAGRAVNAALFSAFDEMLAQLSYDLGYAAAGFIAGEDT